MTRQHIRILLVILIGLLSTEVLAQPVITIAPQAVGGVSSWTSTQPFNTSLTPFFSGLVDVEGSYWGLTGIRNFAFALGVGYDSRATGGQGRVLGPYTSNYETRLSYADIDASFRYHWLQAGVTVGIPLNGNVNVNYGGSFVEIGDIPNTYLNTTFGIFAATNFLIAEWSPGKLDLVARLDYEVQNPFSNGYFVFMSADSPTPITYFPGSGGPIFLARLGLSYEFTAWCGTP
jgi:hypothetical protein